VPISRAAGAWGTVVEKTPEDRLWHGWKHGQVVVSVALSLAREQMGATDSVMASRCDVALKTIQRVREGGDAIRVAGFAAREDVPRYLTAPHRINQARKYGVLADSLIDYVGGGGEPLLQDLVGFLSSKLGGAAQGDGVTANDAAAAGGAEPAAGAALQPESAIEEAQRNGLLARLIGATLGVSEDTMRAAYASMGGSKKKNSPQLNFLCYRFHSNPKLVVRSYLAVVPPTELICAPFFVNVAMEAEATDKRFTRGIVIPRGDLLYFIGDIIGNSALKLLVLNRPSTASRTYVGMVLCVDEDRTQIAARILVKECDFVSDTEAAVAPPMDVEAARAELGDTDLDKIRNRIPFEIEDGNPVLEAGAAIDAKQLREDTRDALMIDGKPLFMTRNNRPFNPADGSHYTFNAALAMWRRGL